MSTNDDFWDHLHCGKILLATCEGIIENIQDTDLEVIVQASVGKQGKQHHSLSDFYQRLCGSSIPLYLVVS